MSKFDEFDLDVQNLKGNDGGGAQESVAEVTWLVSGIIIGSVLTGCSSDCYSTKCAPSQSPMGSGGCRVY